MLDLGSGALGALAAAADLRALDAVLLTHLHPDHCMDLTALYVARKLPPAGPAPAAARARPQGTARRIAAAYRTTPGEGVDGLERGLPIPRPRAGLRCRSGRSRSRSRGWPTRSRRSRSGSAAGGAVRWSTAVTPGPTQALVDLARGADLALFEASFLSGRRQPAQPAPDRDARRASTRPRPGSAGCFSPTWSRGTILGDCWRKARGAFDGDVALAAPGMVVEL